MRHRISHRKLNRTMEHRIALRRNQAQSLFEHGQIRTTIQKAKDLRPFVEKLITLAKKTHAGSLTARRQIHKLLSDRSLIPAEHQSAYDDLSNAKRAKVLRNASGRRYRTGEARGKQRFTGETVSHRLIETVAPRFTDREGGYTRIIRLPDRRLGDHSELAILQLVGDEVAPGSLTRPQKTARRKRADARYAAAVKGARKGGGKATATASAPKSDPPAGDAVDSPEA